MREDFNLQRYQDACHQMQTGVKFYQETGSNEGSPKHLRVGINVALCDHAALVGILVEKGILTKEEYLEAIRIKMEEEVERYKRLLKDKLGREVDLI